MKNLFITVILLFVVNVSFAQARIGWKEQDIRNDFPNYYFQTDYLDNGTKFMTSFDFVGAKGTYFFDSYGYCYLFILIPNNLTSLNFYVEKYNENYVIISNTEWRAYLDNGIIRIKLIFGDDTFFGMEAIE